MRVLLDTNIIIHRESAKVLHAEIGVLFNWLDKLGYEKCVHPITVVEIEKYRNKATVEVFSAKLNSYHLLKTTAPDLPQIEEIKQNIDRSENDINDSTLLNELAAGRVDMLITEDRNIHKKAKRIGVALSVFTIDAFLEKANAENPTLQDYQVLAVRKEYFGNINIHDSFFDSFRSDYPGFDSWFAKKSDEEAYICSGADNSILAFLYVKVEDTNENYFDINPILPPKKRLKIGTFKVISNGFKVGERFVKIIFDNAVRFNVDEIYVTAFESGDNKLRLIKLLEDWGFMRHGLKGHGERKELVLVRPCSVEHIKGQTRPRLTYPYARSNTNKWLVPIYPQYHTELFPDSILNTESATDFVENSPNRNAISKVYITRSFNKEQKPGDIVVFYRTKSGGSAWYTSVTTTIGVIQSVERDIPNLDTFVSLCRRRSVFSDAELASHWNYNSSNRPFVVNFMYLYSLPKRLNLKALTELQIWNKDAPRGFELMTDEQFETLLRNSDVDRRIIID